jgi:hypothetical protein
VLGLPAVIIQFTEDQYGRVQRTLETTPGYLGLNQDIVLPGGSFLIGLFARQVYTLPVNFGDSAFLEAI